jgi:hypothetical protein
MFIKHPTNSMPVVSPSFAFASSSFAIALKVFDRKGGSAKIEEFQASTAGRSLEGNTPGRITTATNLEHWIVHPCNPRERPIAKGFCGRFFPRAFEAFCGSEKQVDQMLREAHHLTPSCPRPPTFSRRGCFFPLPFRPRWLLPATLRSTAHPGAMPPGLFFDAWSSTSYWSK